MQPGGRFYKFSKKCSIYSGECVVSKTGGDKRAEALSPILDRAAEDYLKSEDLTNLRIAEEPDDYE